MSDLNHLLEFWFTSANPKDMASHRDVWWKKDTDFDQTIQGEFGPLFKKAREGELKNWRETPLGCVGLVLLLDQFPRNMFRNDAQAFAYDQHARKLTRHVLAQGFDENLPLAPRVFLYLPLEHSEDLTDQNDCVALIKTLNDEGYLDFAIKHRDIIAKFGRFPHRNEVLGRQSTPEEIEFLQQPGSSF